MCELLGFTAREPVDIRAQLRVFYSHSDKHPHGWGIMHSGGVIEKGKERASDSRPLEWLIGALQPQTTLLGHIRYATVGSIKLKNCHPFSDEDVTGRRWTLIHNGTIYSGSRLIPY
ncbi:MAG: class II glutamine amidotransferase, partial [Ruminococcus sp.]|nr:class II glutamine amidotransferase [Ruminococcus sp.]